MRMQLLTVKTHPKYYGLGSSDTDSIQKSGEASTDNDIITSPGHELEHFSLNYAQR